MRSDYNRLTLALLLLRLGVFVVMFIWTLDKFIQPEHSVAIFENFYLIGGMGSGFFNTIGALQMLIIFGFVVGLFSKWTYGLVLAMHMVSTFSSWKQYLEPFDNLLFFAAWPMLAACVALFLLREDDRLLSMDTALGLGRAKD